MTRLSQSLILTILAVCALAVCPRASHGAPPPGQQSWALLIGLSKFEGGKYPLPYVAQDLKLAECIATRFGFDHVIKLTDAQASGWAIEAALERIGRETHSGDRVLIYVSTHGTRVRHVGDVQSQYALVAYDDLLTFADLLKHTAQMRRRAHVFWLVDSCYAPNVFRGAGGAVSKFVPTDTLSESEALAETRGMTLSIPPLGQAVITASGKYQESWPTFVNETTHDPSHMVSAYTLAFYRAMFFNPPNGRRFDYRWVNDQIAPTLKADSSKDGPTQEQEPWIKVASEDALVFDHAPWPAGIRAQVTQGGRVALDAGLFAGLRLNDSLSLYDASDGSPVGTLIVNGVGDFSAVGRVVRHSRPLPPVCTAEPSLAEWPKFVTTKFISGGKGAEVETALARADENIVIGDDGTPDAVVTVDSGRTPTASVLFPLSGIHLQVRGADAQQIAARLHKVLSSTPLMSRLRLLQSDSPSFHLRLTSRTPSYALGDRASYTLEANRPCEAYLFDVDSGGDVAQLLPYASQTGHLAANLPQEVPNGFVITVSGSVGTDLLIAIAVADPAGAEDVGATASAVLPVEITN